MIRYKLTDQNMITHKGFQWELNKLYRVSGKGELCTDGWLHVYTSPELAVLLNPIHANIKDPRLFKCKVSGKTLKDNGLKEGWSKVKLLKEIHLPEYTTNQRTAFGILCAKEVYKDKDWNAWADNWLSGKDRSEAADAARAAEAAWAAARVESVAPIDLIGLAKQALKAE